MSAVVLAPTATTTAGAAESERSTFEERPTALYLQLGLGTPTGTVGVEAERMISPFSAVTAGAGIGATGAQGAAMVRLLRGDLRLKVVLGAGVSGGHYSWFRILYGHRQHLSEEGRQRRLGKLRVSVAPTDRVPASHCGISSATAVSSRVNTNAWATHVTTASRTIATMEEISSISASRSVTRSEPAAWPLPCPEPFLCTHPHRSRATRTASVGRRLQVPTRSTDEEIGVDVTVARNHQPIHSL